MVFWFAVAVTALVLIVAAVEYRIALAAGGRLVAPVRVRASGARRAPGLHI